MLLCFLIEKMQLVFNMNNCGATGPHLAKHFFWNWLGDRLLFHRHHSLKLSELK